MIYWVSSARSADPDLSRAAALYEAARPTGNEGGQVTTSGAVQLGKALSSSGVALLNMGLPQYAMTHFAHALNAETGNADTSAREMCLVNLAICLEQAQWFSAARALLALVDAESESRDPHFRAYLGLHRTLAMLELRGDTPSAWEARDARPAASPLVSSLEAWTVAMGPAREDFAAASLIACGIAWYQAMDFDRALQKLHESYRLSDRAGLLRLRAIAATWLGRLLGEIGDYGGAEGFLCEASRDLHALRCVAPLKRTWEWLGETYSMKGDARAAFTLAREAVKLQDSLIGEWDSAVLTKLGDRHFLETALDKNACIPGSLFAPRFRFDTLMTHVAGLGSGGAAVNNATTVAP